MAAQLEVDGLFETALARDRVFTDRLFSVLMAVQWAAAVLSAWFISPRTWIGQSSEVHVHVYGAILLGGVVASLPIALAAWYPGRTVTRHTVAVAQMVFSALLIHTTGGRIETHFHVFGSLAFLAFYRDTRVLVTATVVITLDHLLRGIYWPQSVFGVIASTEWRWAEHAAWVLAEDAVLWVSVRRGLGELALIASQQGHLEEARRSAQTANQAKSVFLANMSHEIRTPMTAILGFADVLLEEDRQARGPRADAARTIQRNGEYLLELINGILDLSKIEAGKLGLERGSFSPAVLIEDLRSLMEIRARGKGLDFEVTYATGLPERVQGDPVRLRQILINLVGNAVKFTEVGRVGVRVAVRNEAGIGSLFVEVEDTGIGIGADQIDRVFEPFRQAEGSTARVHGGTGLGLSICKGLTELMEGNIRVESEPGRGSRFCVEIPFGWVEPASWIPPEDIPDAAARPEPASEVPLLDALRGLHVLLVEDGPDNQMLLCHLLQRAGGTVEIAENGQLALDAVERAENGAFDAILMDMQMPVMDGYTATERLRADGFDRPILALTAHAMVSDRARCLRAGCDDYITKPVSPRQLVAAIRDAVKLGA